MFGLESIKAINATEAARREDEARRKRGLKPKGPLGELFRRAARKPVNLVGVPLTSRQGRVSLQ